jgi:hypothetical protein
MRADTIVVTITKTNTNIISTGHQILLKYGRKVEKEIKGEYEKTKQKMI